MAALIPLATGAILLGVIGAFLRLSLLIRKEDRLRGSLRFDAPSRSTRTARHLIGFSSSRWD
jgi:hypothetical protein